MARRLYERWRQLELAVQVAAVVFAAAWLLQALLVGLAFVHLTPDLNDDVLHLRAMDVAAASLRAGGDPTDPWLATITEGFPLFHHYQHLPHVVLALVRVLVPSGVPSLALLRISQSLLLLAFPASLAWGLGRLGAGTAGGLWAGALGVLLATRGLYGLELTSYGWGGYGLTTQLWAAVLMPVAWTAVDLALGPRAAPEPSPPPADAPKTEPARARLAGAAAAWAALLVTHAVLAYATGLTAGVLWLARGRSGVGQRFLRLLSVVGLAAAAASYFLLPFFLDRAAMNRSVWEAGFKYDGYGLSWTLGSLVSGDLFDGSTRARVPVLTALVFVGLLATLLGKRLALSSGRRALVLVVLTVVWVLLYAGRPTWGALLHLLPLSDDLHWHRFLVPLQLAGLGVAGVGAASLVEATLRLGRWPRLAASIVAAALLVHTGGERLSTILEQRGWIDETERGLEMDHGALASLMARLPRAGPDRVYAGRAPNWGSHYRLGHVPVYALLTAAGIDNLGFLYHALAFSADIEGYLDESRAAHFRLFDVRYFLAPAGQAPPSFAHPLATAGRHHLYEIDAGGPLALVTPAGDYAGTRAEWFEPARRFVQSRAVEAGLHPRLWLGGDAPADAKPLADLSADLATEPPLAPVTPATPCVGTLGSVAADPGPALRYEATVDADGTCAVLLKSTYHPRWRAQVDGEDAPVDMLAPCFAGVRVPPGRHRVAFTFVPPPWRLPLLAAGVALLGAVALIERRRPRIPPAVP